MANTTPPVTQQPDSPIVLHHRTLDTMFWWDDYTVMASESDTLMLTLHDCRPMHDLGGPANVCLRKGTALGDVTVAVMDGWFEALGQRFYWDVKVREYAGNADACGGKEIG